MKLRFKVQRYQTEAVDAVVDCFAGQPRAAGIGNAEIALSPSQLLENIRAVQRSRVLPVSPALVPSPAAAPPNTPNLDIEMETGTGKTYVFIKTIMELNKRYGWSKFIVVVPNVAIREGARNSFSATAEHFQLAYGSKPNSFCYKSSFLHELERFSSDGGVQVMIINIQAFNATGKDGRRIYDVLDDFQSRRPIDVISATRPIVIIDEPQRVGAAKSLAALAQFNPLMILRYSATHRVEHNKVYRLDALDAYNQKLVKKIAVRGITVQGRAGSAAYLYLDTIEIGQGVRPRARVELEVRTASAVKRVVRRLGLGADLYEVSGGISAYQGLVVTDIDANRDVIELSDGTIITAGQVTADVTEEAKRRIQIREVIRSHLDKERELFPLGIKVLSLFFIDEVAKYRDYSRADTSGPYARVFAEEYNSQVNDLLGQLAADEAAAKYRRYLTAIPVESTHQGYFSIDKKTGWDIDGDVKRTGDEKGHSTDASAYDLILRDKERLLSLDEKVRFIFSHSALREGWDNPNVFVLGMLKKSDNTVSRRQEIGRGLRLSVDQHGERTDDPATVHSINELTVVTDESYTAFVDGLQRELSDSPGPRPPLPVDGRKTKRIRLLSDGPSRAEFIPHNVGFDSDVLVGRCVRALDAHLTVEALRYVVQTGEQRAPGLMNGPSFIGIFTSTDAGTGHVSSMVQYDLLGEMATKTKLTRRTVASILSQISPATFAQYRQNPEQFITESVRLVNAQKTEVMREGTVYVVRQLPATLSYSKRIVEDALGLTPRDGLEGPQDLVEERQARGAERACR